MKSEVRSEVSERHSYILVVCDVFIKPRINDVSDVYGSDVIEQYVEPHNDDGNRKTVAYEQDGFVLK